MQVGEDSTLKEYGLLGDGIFEAMPAMPALHDAR